MTEFNISKPKRHITFHKTNIFFLKLNFTHLSKYILIDKTKICWKNFFWKKKYIYLSCYLLIFL